MKAFVLEVASEGAGGAGAGEEGGSGKTGGGGDGGGGIEAAVEDGFELGETPYFHVEVLGFSHDTVLVAGRRSGIFTSSDYGIMSPRL